LLEAKSAKEAVSDLTQVRDEVPELAWRGCTNLEELGALGHIAFRYTDSVGTQNQFSIAAQWLACAFPCRRFADTLADAYARLGADVDCYSFVVVDLHHLLLAGLPAHLCENPI
jgi:hypothetical protein